MGEKPPLWTCERCGRSFANRNQTHSCRPLTDLATHFEGTDPKVRVIFDRLVALTEKQGSFEILAEKTRIAFHNRMSFAAFTPKRAWLTGHVVLAERLDSPRFTRVEKYSPHNVVHSFRLDDPVEVDEEVERWLRLAYQVGAQRHLKRGKAVSPGADGPDT